LPVAQLVTLAAAEEGARVMLISFHGVGAGTGLRPKIGWARSYYLESRMQKSGCRYSEKIILRRI